MSLVLACALDELGSLPLAVTLTDSSDESVDVAIVRIDDEVFAINDLCSHGHVPLSEGDVDQNKCTLECYLHGSAFDLRTGAALNLPATQAVPVYPTEIRDGSVFVDLDNPIDPASLADKNLEN